MAGTATTIGPFVGGLNTRSDETAVADNELVKCENFELDLDGSLVSRPPIVDNGVSMSLGSTGNVSILGYYYATGGVAYLIGSDGLNSTYYYSGTSWVLLTNTIAASAMTQFNNQAWLLAPLGSANPGGYWTPSGGFVADANMPKGEVLVAQKARLWVASGKDATANGTRMYFSEVLGTTPFWKAVPDFIDVGSGDGQNIVQIVVYYTNLLIFRSNSVYTFQYSSDPATGVVSLIIPGIGLADKDAIVSHESFIYFMFDDRAYEFYNNRATQINIKVPFAAISRAGLYKPYSVSIFGNRVVFSYFDTMFIFSLNTRTWTTWISTVHGAIGRVISLASSGEFEVAVTHSSRVVPPGTVRTNLVRNPVLGTAVTDWSVGSWAGGAGTAGRVSLSSFWWYQMTFTTAPAGFGATITNFGVGNSPVTPGLAYSARIFGRVSWAGAQMAVRLYWYTAAGALLSSGPSGAVATPGAGAGVVYTVEGAVAPAGAGIARLDFYQAGGTLPPVNGTMEATEGFVENATTFGGFFYGNTPASGDFTYAWSGTANASTSIQTAVRKSKTLFITDGVTGDTELMHCIVQTKNYNYEASSIYKKLFWWGADAAYRGTVVAIATPIVYNYSVTWGQLLATTWGTVKNFTWGQPISGTLSVETTRDTAGTGAIRKFTKFMKAMRFRQVNFKIDFETDGSTSSAPVRLFSLMTYVAAKERVAKTVT